MSRAINLMGQFYTEGCGALPWTKQDEDRLHGRFLIAGRQTKPHVSTPSGPFVIGAIPCRTVNYRLCPDCGERRVRCVDKRTETYRCESCGRDHSLQYLLARTPPQ